MKEQQQNKQKFQAGEVAMDVEQIKEIDANIGAMKRKIKRMKNEMNFWEDQQFKLFK